MTDLTVGVLADIHANRRAVRLLIGKLLRKKVDVIAAVGDFCTYGSSKKEILDVLTALCTRVPCPVIVFPGNYENAADYEDAIKTCKKKFPQLIDGARKRITRIRGYDLVTLPGARFNARRCTYFLMSDRRELKHTKSFIKEQRKYFGPLPYRFFYTRDLKNIITDPSQTIVLTHEPPLSTKGAGIDISKFRFTANGREKRKTRAGNPVLRSILLDMKPVAVASGHIHESGRKAVTLGGVRVRARHLRKTLLYNPGPAAQGYAGILHVTKSQASFENLRI